MLMVISPAKTLDFDTAPVHADFTQPDLLAHSQLLIERARLLSALDIAELMKVSMKIAELNHARFADWQAPFSPDNAKQAVLAFKGDVYTGLDAERFSAEDFAFAQNHLRMLSGLYGVLRPLDLMQAYRLEMGTKLDNLRGKNLYEFWGEIIAQTLNQALQAQATNSPVLVNLASNEYFKAVKVKALNAPVITPTFKENKNGQYKMLGVYAKKARGLMARFVIQNRLTDVASLKDFALEGYAFKPELSDDATWCFTRG